MAGALATVSPQWLLARPEYAAATLLPARGQAVRIQGLVSSAGQAIAGVPVTDGRTIVDTDADGRFTLVTTSDRPFVYISVPSGYEIPQNATGTARFYRPIEADRNGEQRVLFELTRLPDGDHEHAFVVLADTQTQSFYEMRRFRLETVPDVVQTRRDLGERPVFGVACGDIMFDDLSFYPDYEAAVSDMGVPFFQVVGNHDLNFDAPTDAGTIDTFMNHFGPNYYSFDRGEIHYIVLDDVFWYNEGYMGHIDATQLAWLEADLSRIERGRTVVVFQHIPMMSTADLRNGAAKPGIAGSVTNREYLYRLLSHYRTHIVSGHTHEHEHVFEGGVHEHILGTACGAWWSGDICWDGTPNGYAVFEARGSRLTWYYKSTGQPADYQARVYPMGIDPLYPDSVVLNVWDADPTWGVIYEDNRGRRGGLSAKLRLDPRSIVEHTGDAVPEHRPWVEPRLTNHLFYLDGAQVGDEVTVELRDRFGRRLPVPFTVTR